MTAVNLTSPLSAAPPAMRRPASMLLLPISTQPWPGGNQGSRQQSSCGVVRSVLNDRVDQFALAASTRISLTFSGD